MSDTNSQPQQLSYSSATLLKNCSQKYFHYKVAGTSRDPDSEQNETAFNVGKCFHWVMEENGHTDNNLVPLLESAVKAFEVEQYESMIHAMLLRYLQVHKKSGLTAIKCELGLNFPEFIGFIDVILADADGYWWMGDLKTAKFFNDLTRARLTRDVQLNLYANFAEVVAEQLELDVNKFAGCRYRVTTKSELKRKTSESYMEHVLRTAKNVKSYDVVIPIELMSPALTMMEHEELHGVANKLRDGSLEPRKNKSYCDSFFRPCEYWSQCYGKTFTECKNELEVLTSDNV